MSEKITAKETAEILKVSTATLKNWRKLGKGPGYERLDHGRTKLVYSKDEVLKFKKEKIHV